MITPNDCKPMENKHDGNTTIRSAKQEGETSKKCGDIEKWREL
jgi:hypothetical protein